MKLYYISNAVGKYDRIQDNHSLMIQFVESNTLWYHASSYTDIQQVEGGLFTSDRKLQCINI